jgi:hypothetical protein
MKWLHKLNASVARRTAALPFVPQRVLPPRPVALVAPFLPDRPLALIPGLRLRIHDRTIGVVQPDCIDDQSAIKSARRLVDSHDVELWQTDRPVARFDARSKQMCKK